MTPPELRVIESPYLVKDGEPYAVRRSWRERLFSWPWHPLVTTRTIVPKVPYAIQLNQTTLVMHPALVQRLKEQSK